MEVHFRMSFSLSRMTPNSPGHRQVTACLDRALLKRFEAQLPDKAATVASACGSFADIIEAEDDPVCVVAHPGLWSGRTRLWRSWGR